jgi:hypothetical protein
MRLPAADAASAEAFPPTLNEWVSRSDLALGRAEPDTGQDRVSGYPLIIGDGDRDSARG